MFQICYFRKCYLLYRDMRVISILHFIRNHFLRHQQRPMDQQEEACLPHPMGFLLRNYYERSITHFSVHDLYESFFHVQSFFLFVFFFFFLLCFFYKEWEKNVGCAYQNLLLLTHREYLFFTLTTTNYLQFNIIKRCYYQPSQIIFYYF